MGAPRFTIDDVTERLLLEFALTERVQALDVRELRELVAAVEEGQRRPSIAPPREDAPQW